MTAELVFYTHPMTRGRIVRWMLEEVGQPYETRLLEAGSTMKTPAYLAINPMGKVPTISHGAVVVTECAAICAYLADAFPQAGLAPPPGDPNRGAYYRWLFFTAGPVEAAFTNQNLGVVVPEAQAAGVGYGSVPAVINMLEHAVASGSGYVAGDDFTAADLYLGSALGWGMMTGTIEQRPAFEAYLARLARRPAAIRAREIDDALLAGQAAPASN